MNKQVELANEIIERVAKSKQATLDISDYVTYEVPPGVFELTWLSELRLQGMSLKSLPPEIVQLQDLEELWLDGNPMDSLPASLARLTKLKRLAASFLPSLRYLPEEFSNLASLLDLRLTKTALAEFPVCIRAMRSLRKLEIGSPHIRTIPDWLAELGALLSLSFSGCPFDQVPNCIREMRGVEHLSLKETSIDELPDWLEQMNSIKTLNLEKTQMKTVPDWVWNSQTLERVVISGLPDPPGFPVHEKRFRVNNIEVQKFF